MVKLNRTLQFAISLVVDIILTYFRIFHPNIFTFLFGLVSINCFLFMSKFILEAIQSSYWPQVQGEIVISEMGKTASYRVSVYPIVEYSYTVEGKNYQSDRIKIGPQSIS